ncbi:MAG TPA: response regulator [Candidatus Methylomirabilis sp.]|jgi:PAS domain S-box-containing protein|nr:response regulator [Candidatus Methylomirabilis sp.]
MKQLRVLIVDNDRFVVEAVGDILAEAGYLVRKAYDGLEGLRALRREPPDVLILDLIMPKVDGGRLCRYLRQDRRLRHIPVIIFSGLAARDMGELGGLDAQAYVAKGPLPIVSENLLKALKTLAAPPQGAEGTGVVFGYEGFRPRQVVTELLVVKRHHEHLLRHLEEGVVEVDAAGAATFLNPSAEAFLGVAEAGAVGKALVDLLPEADQRPVRDALDVLGKDEGGGPRHVTLRGTPRPLEAALHYLPPEGTQPGGYILILREA